MFPQTVVKSDLTDNKLIQECMVFAFYLTGVKPTEYVIDKYKQGNQSGNFLITSRFDNILLKFAVFHPSATRIADTYSRIFYRNSLIQRKLILILAILECSSPAYKYFDKPEASNKLSFVLKTFWVGIYFIFMFFASLIFLLPLQILTRIVERFSQNRNTN